MARDTVFCVVDDDVYEIDAEDVEDAPEEGGFYAPVIDADGSYVAGGECPDFYADYPAFDENAYAWEDIDGEDEEDLDEDDEDEEDLDEDGEDE